jgi:predicted nucleic acid-binding protein
MSADRRRFGLDTNVLIHAIEAGGGAKRRRAELIVRRAVATRRCVLSLPARASATPRPSRRRRAADFGRLFATVAASLDEVRVALTEAAAGRFSYRDALLLATLGRAGCGMLLSEDMADGATLAGTVVHDPFGGDQLPREVEALLAAS